MSLPTPPREPDSVPVLNSTPLPAFTQSWQLRPPDDAQILIVKGTFDLAPDAPATPAEEQELPLGPMPFEGAEVALRYPGDTAFFKPRCDVLIAGHAYSSEQERRIRRLTFDFGRAISYSIAAIGDRVWTEGVPSEPAPFDKIELRPERAFGGPGDPRNPIGVGRHSADGSPLPSFELPDQLIRSRGDAPPPALTTPLHDTWPERTQHRGSYGGDWVTRRAPYFPDDFRWDYFQAAPPPLRIEHPRGDEWYRLIGFRPNDETLQGQLPCLKLRAFGQPLEHPDTLAELPLLLDTVWFEPDQLRVVLVWRGAIGSSDQFGSDLASLFLLAEPIGQPCDDVEIRHRFVATYEAEYVATPEQDEPDEPDTVARPPEGYVAPRGLTASRARALGLPPWAATVDEPPIEPAPPPPPRPTMTPARLEARLESDEPLLGEDLSRCDLSGRDLRGRDLAEVLLIGASLVGAKLAGANLTGAVLSEANLEDADLTGADLTDATLDGASLARARLDGASLPGASLQTVRAPDASFVGAVLDGALAYGSDFTRARFEEASLLEADLSECRLEDARFERANLDDVRLYGAVGPRVVLDDASLARSRLDGASFIFGSFARVKAADSSLRLCDLSDSNWTEAVLEESVIEDTVLDRANLNQVEAKECRWPRARAHDATFVKANLMRGYFEGAELIGCDLRGANLYEAETFRATFSRCRFDHAILGESGLG